MWTIQFFDQSVQESILAMPAKLQARMLKLLDLIKKQGPNLGPPHTEALGDGLFEVRAKAQEGIGRAFFLLREKQKYCYPPCFH
jgi:phage-related protein